MSMTLLKSRPFARTLPIVSLWLALVSLAFLVSCRRAHEPATTPESAVKVGVARIDITPDYPIRLAGYMGRKTESERIEQRLWAKALAIQYGSDSPALLLSVENIGIPAAMTDEVAVRLNRHTGIPRERLVICATHTHTGPRLEGVLPTLFGEDHTDDQMERIARYTAELTDHLERVSLDALADIRPARIEWAVGQAGFAINRRVMRDGRSSGLGVNPEGPVDHTMSMLSVHGPDDQLRAVVVNYACHCTTHGADFNRICGDWAGFAQNYVEKNWPGVTCLVTIGCGADANPHPRTGLEFAQQHGQEIATEVDRLLAGELKPIQGLLTCRLENIALPFGEIPDRAEWDRRVAAKDATSYHASFQLARLDRGEDLATPIPYPVQAWMFGEDLAMIFLAGEVVVDYVHRLNREFDADRLWVTAFANDVSCYIPSERVLAEGGYEPDRSMLLYGWPTTLSPGIEELVIGAIHRLVPESFLVNRVLTPVAE